MDLFNFFGNIPAMAMGPQTYEQKLHCYPVAFVGKEALETGGKILLPASALDTLARLKVTYPMMFELASTKTSKKTYCGVLEFSAEEGYVYIPYWMMENLDIDNGDIITVRNVSLKKATYIKFRPYTTDFTQLSNPRVVLETCLRNFACVKKGDTIKIVVDGHAYYLEVTDTQPNEAVSLFETDLKVDFDPPKDYQEYEQKMATAGTGTASSSTPSPASASPIIPAKQGVVSSPLIRGASEHLLSTETTEPKLEKQPSYFDKLGAGYSLKGKKGTPLASAATVTNVTLQPMSLDKPAAPQQQQQSQSQPQFQRSMSVSSTSSTSSSSGTKSTKVVTQGNFDYIYEVDEATKKERLIRRIARRNSTTNPPSSTSASSSTAATSSKPFTPFGGSGYKLSGNKP